MNIGISATKFIDKKHSSSGSLTKYLTADKATSSSQSQASSQSQMKLKQKSTIKGMFSAFEERQNEKKSVTIMNSEMVSRCKTEAKPVTDTEQDQEDSQNCHTSLSNLNQICKSRSIKECLLEQDRSKSSKTCTDTVRFFASKMKQQDTLSSLPVAIFGSSDSSDEFEEDKLCSRTTADSSYKQTPKESIDNYRTSSVYTSPFKFVKISQGSEQGFGNNKLQLDNRNATRSSAQENKNGPKVQHPRCSTSIARNSDMATNSVQADSNDYINCMECSRSILIWEMPEHSDFHFAQSLMKEQSAEFRSQTGIVSQKRKRSGRGRGHGVSSNNKRTKAEPIQTISKFFAS